MNQARHPYDALPYESLPISWTAPEHLALTALLHGGPRQATSGYRYLELGCGDGSNLIPLAYYRPDAEFVGVDGAPSACEQAATKAQQLGLRNLRIVQADFEQASLRLTGSFEFIVGHGVFSWIPDQTRDRLLDLCQDHLKPAGLLYLSYNARPGWDIRGLIRDFLIRQTRGSDAPVSPLAQAEQAQHLAKTLADFLSAVPAPYTQLLTKEFQLVQKAQPGYVGHDYLAAHNRAYWRADFLALLQRRGFSYVADADYNDNARRLPDGVEPRLQTLGLPQEALQDTLDLVCFRQFHCPILTTTPNELHPPSANELSQLHIASCLQAPEAGDTFLHPSGYQAEVPDPTLQQLLRDLAPDYPRGRPVSAVLADPAALWDDILLLQRNGLLELRQREPNTSAVNPAPLHELEGIQGYHTSPYHTTVATST